MIHNKMHQNHPKNSKNCQKIEKNSSRNKALIKKLRNNTNKKFKSNRLRDKQQIELIKLVKRQWDLEDLHGAVQPS
jgi:hypothetical protein